MPDVIAEVTTTEADRSEEVVLTLHKQWKRRSLGDDPSRHLDPISTALEPKPTSGDDTVYWLVGYGLEAHEQPGDTRVTYSLLVQVAESGETVQTLWWEDHMEVPTSLFNGSGTLTQTEASAQLSAKLKHIEYGDELAISGSIRGL
ncbi:MAG: hypothetical protein KC912_26100 [Proteobacteria bacterium]|nr:hypothetical protein [Pseudomonadota bacterium]